MGSSGREPQHRVAGRRASLLASSTLVAALGFTTGILHLDSPWAQFLFRTAGLAALAFVSWGALKGAVVRSEWQARAAMGSILLVAVSLLSTVVSVHRGKSLEAMLNLLAIVGLFLAAALLVRGARHLRLVALLQVLAAVPVAAVGIAQHFRPDLLPPGNPYPGRALGPLGSFGQPNRLGGFLIGIIPVALVLAFLVQDRVLKAALLAGVLALTLCLAATLSRGSWLAFGASVLGLGALLALGVILRKLPASFSDPLLVGGALAALVLPFALLAPAIQVRVRPPAPTAPAWNLPIDPEREGSGAMRRAVWSGAVAAAAERPILGWGIGAFREAYDRSKSDTLKRLEAEGGRTADQAHSFYLETLSERGVLGLVALLIFVAFGVGAGVATLAGPSAELRLLGAGLLASILALLAHGLLEDNLSLMPHGVLFSTNLGLLVATAPSRNERVPVRRPGFALIGFGFSVLALALSAGSAGAAMLARDGSAELRAGRTERAMERATAALRLAPWDDRYAVARAEVAEAAARGGRGIAALREAERSYRHALTLNGSDPVTRHQLARLYLAHADVFGPGGVQAALRELRAALAQNPHYAEIRNDLGVAFLASGDRRGAREAFLAASDGRRDFVDPLLNLATLSLEEGNVAEAKRMVALALERNPGSARAAALRARITGQPHSAPEHDRL